MDTSEEFSFENADPLARFIKHRLNWSPITYGLAILIANIIVNGSFALRFRAFITQTGPPGLFQDPTILFESYVMMPVVGGFYIWSILRIGALLHQLHNSNIFVEETGIEKLTLEVKQNIRSRAALIFSFIVASVVTFLTLGKYLGWFRGPEVVSFLNHSYLLPWVRSPLWFLSMYAICFGLFNIGVTVITLRRVFRDHAIRISPWHPDRCGGLRSISQYSMTLGYAIAVLGIFLSIQTIQEIQIGIFETSYLTWLELAGYIILAPLVFFLPLGTAHTAMRNAKTTHLLALSHQFDAHYTLIVDSLQSDDREIGSSAERIEQLQTLYQITEDFIIWPFDVVNLRRFLTITLAPLLPGVASVLFELIRIFLVD
ncbi:MAG: hypothetical protein AMJ88_15830 [Anaerolineae bacterium SM23_ 63]|nr:MAG: hypothetical protein AMJ88_15830 [Anaerolineae bacterium SM23_ 63]HEY45668.1 hypothetical protein [Anaerolineae bacterium]